MADEEIQNDQVESSEVENTDLKEAESLAKEIDPEVSVESEKDLQEFNEIKSETEDKEEANTGILTKIKEKLTGKKADVVETKTGAEEGKDIPDKFTEVARSIGWTDEDIQDFAVDYSDEQLLEMIDYLGKEDKKVEDKVVKKEEKTETETKKEDVKATPPEIVALQKEITSLKDRLSKDDEARQKDETRRMVATANEFFDKVSDEMEIFGKTKELKKFPDGSLVPVTPEYKARSQVWDDALMLYNAGLPFDRALKKAFFAYKGENLEKNVSRKIIKDLKNNEERLSPDRYNKTTEKTYKDEVERREDIVKDLARKAGVNLD
jgi:hypothetical protein